MIQDPNHDLAAVAGKAVLPFVPFSDRAGGTVAMGGREYLDFTSWDVLGCGQSAAIKRALVQSLETVGFVSPSSRLSSGTTEAHQAFERRYSQFFAAEAALLCSSRNQCVLSVVTALFGEGDAVFFDESSEAPIGDACALVGAAGIPYKFNNLDLVEEEASRLRLPGRRALFCDSVSIVSGRIFDVGRASLLCSKIGADLFLDDSAALGLYGPRGAADFDGGLGAAAASIRYASLAHGAGLTGGCLCGRRNLVESIVVSSRTLGVEHPLPPFIAATGCQVLDYLELQLATRQRLKLLGQRVSRELCSFGLESYGEGPIVGVVLPSFRLASAYRDALLERLVLVDSLSSPLQFKERGLLRILLSAFHNDSQVALLLEGLREVHRRLVKRTD